MDHPLETDKSFEKHKKETLRIALYAGEIMLKNGAETYRVEDTIIRICNSRNLKYINAFVTPTVIIVSDSRFDGQSFIRRIQFRDTNLEKVSKVNDFSRFFEQYKDIGFKEALDELKRISNLSSYSFTLRLFCGGFVACAFALLFGSDILSASAAFFVSLFSVWIYGKLHQISEVSFLANYVSSFLIGLIALSMQCFFQELQYDMVITGSIMPLLPGFALTNGIRDFISGDLISGVSRVSEAFIIAVSIAFGVGSAFKVFMTFGGVIG